jgi:hypothetical protein
MGLNTFGLFSKTEIHAQQYQNNINIYNYCREASNKQGDVYICRVHTCQCVDTKHKPKTKQVPKYTQHTINVK